jgi:hypothetical protein
MLAAYIMLSFAGLLRYCDVAVILVSDVNFFVDRADVFLSVRKNDQFREGHIILISRGKTDMCPVLLLERYISMAGIQGSVPLFRHFNGHLTRGDGLKEVPLLDSGLPYSKACSHELKWIAKFLGMEVSAAQAKFGLHSLPSGGATHVANSKLVSERLFQQHGGWLSREAMLVYLQASVVDRVSVTGVIDF